MHPLELDKQLGIEGWPLGVYIACLHELGRQEFEGTVDIANAMQPQDNPHNLLPTPREEQSR